MFENSLAIIMNCFGVLSGFFARFAANLQQISFKYVIFRWPAAHSVLKLCFLSDYIFYIFIRSSLIAYCSFTHWAKESRYFRSSSNASAEKNRCVYVLVLVFTYFCRTVRAILQFFYMYFHCNISTFCYFQIPCFNFHITLVTQILKSDLRQKIPDTENRSRFHMNEM